MLAPAGFLTLKHKPAALAGSQGGSTADCVLRSTSGAHTTQHQEADGIISHCNAQAPWSMAHNLSVRKSLACSLAGYFVC